MHEINKRTTGTLSAMQPDLEYIPVCSDPRGIYLSEMYEEDPEPEETSDRDKQQPTLFEVKEIHIRIERQSTLFDVMEKAGSVIGGLASLGMVYVLGCMVVRFGILI